MGGHEVNRAEPRSRVPMKLDSPGQLIAGYIVLVGLLAVVYAPPWVYMAGHGLALAVAGRVFAIASGRTRWLGAALALLAVGLAAYDLTLW